MGNHRVLMVSFAFYPCGTVGALRASTFSKYLPEFGWNPEVLTVKEKHYEIRDDALLGQINPQMKVIKTGYFGIETLKPLLSGFRARKEAAANKKDPTCLKSTIRPAPESWFDLPRGVGWLPFGLLRGVPAAKRCEAIWATSPLQVGLCLGALLSKLTGRPFVADFQDPWYLPELSPYPTALHTKVNRCWERFVLKTASLVVVTTDETKEMYKDLYSVDDDKIIVVHNGYDTTDFDQSAPSASSVEQGELRIGYLGSLYQGRELYMLQLMEALKAMAEKNPQRKIKLHVRGRKPQRAVQLADAANAKDVVDIGGHISHKQAVEMMKAMDILVLIAAPKHTHALPQKVLEYIGAGKPVLAITPEGATSRFVQQHGIGITAEPGETGSIERALEALTKDYGSYLKHIETAAAEFTSRALSEKLAGALTKACETA